MVHVLKHQQSEWGREAAPVPSYIASQELRCSAGFPYQAALTWEALLRNMTAWNFAGTEGTF